DRRHGALAPSRCCCCCCRGVTCVVLCCEGRGVRAEGPTRRRARHKISHGYASSCVTDGRWETGDCPGTCLDLLSVVLSLATGERSCFLRVGLWTWAWRWMVFRASLLKEGRNGTLRRPS
ncbi:unnamed protein product, partial [Hapterophycus canaliculatus]